MEDITAMSSIDETYVLGDVLPELSISEPEDNVVTDLENNKEDTVPDPNINEESDGDISVVAGPNGPEIPSTIRDATQQSSSGSKVFQNLSLSRKAGLTFPAFRIYKRLKKHTMMKVQKGKIIQSN
jgi:hypothetical protein